MNSFQEYTRESCPICGHKGWCGRREDGLVLCKRPPTPPKASGYTFKGMGRDGQTGMFVEIGREFRRGDRTIRRPPAHANITPGAGASPDVRPSLETLFTSSEDAFTPERRAVLAQELGLPELALDKLKIGWSDTASHHADREISGAWVLRSLAPVSCPRSSCPADRRAPLTAPKSSEIYWLGPASISSGGER